MRYLVLVFVVLVGSQPALADRRQNNAPAPVDRRETIKKKIRALRAYTLTEELGLDDKTAAQLFPALAKWDDVTDKLLVARTDLTRQLAAVDSIKDPKVVNKLIDDLVANQKAFWDLEDKRLVELRKILTPVQTAHLVLVLPGFEKRIQNQLRRAIQNRGGGRAGPGRRGGDDDDDDDDDGDLVDPADRRGGDRRGDRRGGNLGGDPFSGRESGAPGNTRRAPTPAPAPARGSGSGTKACDPFTTVHGCLE